MYGYKCEYCDGTVEEKKQKQEAFKHKHGFVILEDVPIGVCNKCGNRYYNARILKRVHEIAENRAKAERMESVPVGQADI